MLAAPHGSSFTKDFIDSIKSFNLIQSVQGSSQLEGPTLDIVLSSGFIPESTELCKARLCPTTKQLLSRS